MKVTAGEKAIFEIELSKGDATTKWYKNGTELEFNQRLQLHIDGKPQTVDALMKLDLAAGVDVQISV